MRAPCAGGRARARRALATLLLTALSCRPAPPVRPTEVVFWQSWPDQVIQPLLAKFEAETTGVHVRMERVPAIVAMARVAAALDSGHVPDLCALSSSALPRFLDSRALADWSAGAADLRTAIRGWEMCSVGETIYGIPWVLRTRALFLDPTLFARARLDPERGPETWEELYRDAAAIQRLGHGVHGFGLCASQERALFEAFMPFAWGNGGEILSAGRDSVRFDSSENRAALTFYLRLRKVGTVGTQTALDREFENGKLGMEISDGTMRTRPCRVERVPRPARDRGTHGSCAEGEVLVSFPGSRHKEAALRLARFLTRPDNAMALARSTPWLLPATIGADTTAYYHDRPGDRMLIRQLETARYRPVHAEWDAMEAAIEKSLAKELLGRLAPPESAASHATASADRAITALLRRP